MDDRIVMIKKCQSPRCTVAVLKGYHGGNVYVHSAIQNGNSLHVPNLRDL